MHTDVFGRSVMIRRIRENLCPKNDVSNTDPLLGPLSDDGGTLVHPLLEGSPAIEGGVCIAGVTGDQRGVRRPEGARCDVGAYEWVWRKVYLPLVVRNWSTQ